VWKLWILKLCSQCPAFTNMLEHLSKPKYSRFNCYLALTIRLVHSYRGTWSHYDTWRTKIWLPLCSNSLVARIEAVGRFQTQFLSWLSNSLPLPGKPKFISALTIFLLRISVWYIDARCYNDNEQCFERSVLSCPLLNTMLLDKGFFLLLGVRISL
jgi:hypothetical protein